MKIKIGRIWGTDIDRDLPGSNGYGHCAGAGVQLMVDANGGYTRRSRPAGSAPPSTTSASPGSKNPSAATTPTAWPPVRAAVRCDVAAGEYVADLYDAAPCARWWTACNSTPPAAAATPDGCAAPRIAARTQPARSPRTAHPSLHAPVAAAIPNLRHIEWFIDHARLEPLLVDGLPDARGGALHPDHTARGHGMTISRQAERWCT